jgi:hypothetical protein
MNRLRLIAAVAEQWLEMGEFDRARRVLEEGRASDNFFQTGFLGQLARLEPQQVIARLRKLPTGAGLYPRNLELAEVAVQLATDHPAEAEQVFNLRDGGNEQGQANDHALQLCRRLARVDPPRARRIAASLSGPAIRACGWAHVALGLAEKDKAGAAEAIDRSIEEIDLLRDSGRGLELPAYIVGVLLFIYPVHPAALLAVVERVAIGHSSSSSVSSRVGRCNSLHACRPVRPRNSENSLPPIVWVGRCRVEAIFVIASETVGPYGLAGFCRLLRRHDITS